MKKSLRFISSIFFILFCIFLFIMALLLMKEGAKPLAPIFRNHISIDSPANALGFGWLPASMVLSGSPIAATSLALLDAHVLLPLESYAMIVGSRLGASFIVLLIGYIYILRGKKREVSLGVGLVSLLVTQTIYLPVMFIGFFLLSLNWLKKWQLLADQSVEFTIRGIFHTIYSIY